MQTFENYVDVFDNVFTSQTAVEIVSKCKKYKDEHNGLLDGLLYRNDLVKDNSSILKLKNPLEILIDDILTKMGDKSRQVEYWYRGMWLDLGCHQDIDEIKFKEELKLLYPHTGYIAYLNEFSYEAATLIFSPSSQKKLKIDDVNNKENLKFLHDECENNINSERDTITVVFPKIGRVTRFYGNAFHYIPNPYTKIFGDTKITNTDLFRFVLLFNTWDNITMDDQRYTCKINSEQEYYANDKKEWVQKSIFQDINLDSDDNIEFTVKYMGSSIRRLGENPTGRFLANRRFERDGFSHEIMRYEIKKANQKEEDLIEHDI